jgi:hypothetical protein
VGRGAVPGIPWRMVSYKDLRRWIAKLGERATLTDSALVVKLSRVPDDAVLPCPHVGGAPTPSLALSAVDADSDDVEVPEPRPSGR